jgi:hypothetical protein
MKRSMEWELKSFVAGMLFVAAGLAQAAPAKIYQDPRVSGGGSMWMKAHLESCSLSGDCSKETEQHLADYFCQLNGQDYASSYVVGIDNGRNYCERGTCNFYAPVAYGCDPVVTPGRYGNPDEVACSLTYRERPVGTRYFSTINCRNVAG